jgi:hypothetical protein
MQETKIPTLSANSESDLIFSALNFVVEDHAAPANFCVLRRGYTTALRLLSTWASKIPVLLHARTQNDSKYMTILLKQTQQL